MGKADCITQIVKANYKGPNQTTHMHRLTSTFVVRLVIYLTSFTVCSGDIKTISENGQSLVFFRAFYFRPPP